MTMADMDDVEDGVFDPGAVKQIVDKVRLCRCFGALGWQLAAPPGACW